MILYHVSPRRNRAGILGYGVLPHLALGKVTLSWWVTKERILWALAHVSARHGIAVSELDVWEGYFLQADVKRTRLEGVYTCDQVHPPRDCKMGCCYAEE